jgi:hypothetical protein
VSVCQAGRQAGCSQGESASGVGRAGHREELDEASGVNPTLDLAVCTMPNMYICTYEGSIRAE